MKKALLGAAGALTLLVAALLGVVAMQPDSLHVERSVVVAAPPADVFPFANDYRQWDQWDPWRAKDPDQKTEISDPPAGVGAWTAWEGDENVGKGKMTITAVEPDAKVVQDLEFFEPWQSKAVATIALAPEGEGTRVTWSFDSQQDFMSKAMSLAMDMDAMLGPDFEQGLANLKGAAEGALAARLEVERLAAEAAHQAAEAAIEAEADAGELAAPE